MDHTEDTIASLIATLSESLTAREWLLGVAESCTGGMLSEHITAVAGSSAWFSCGFITYSNQSKMQMLEVDESTLELEGAVSEAVAAEMALGVLDNSNCSLSVSITGIAGPNGGSALKPIGMVCFAWATNNDDYVTDTQHFSGSRREIRQQATIYALQGLIVHLRQQAS